MTIRAFNAACDDLASQIDATGYERRQWEKSGGAILAEAFAKIAELFAKRDDFSFRKSNEQLPDREKLSGDIMLQEKIVAKLIIRVSGEHFTIYVMNAENGIGHVPQVNLPGPRLSRDEITDEIMGSALAEALRHIEPIK
ncbi:hypothetical protein P0F65_05310 [Sphingomonas sp. I4]